MLTSDQLTSDQRRSSLLLLLSYYLQTQHSTTSNIYLQCGWWLHLDGQTTNEALWVCALRVSTTLSWLPCFGTHFSSIPMLRLSWDNFEIPGALLAWRGWNNGIGEITFWRTRTTITWWRPRCIGAIQDSRYSTVSKTWAWYLKSYWSMWFRRQGVVLIDSSKSITNLPNAGSGQCCQKAPPSSLWRSRAQYEASRQDI